MIKKIEIERFSLTTSKPFDEVIAGVNAAIGQPDMAEFGRLTHEARSFAELKSVIERSLGNAGLMLFMQLDHGAIVRKETGSETPKIIRFVKGNGQARPGCRFLRAGYGSCRCARGRRAFVLRQDGELLSPL
jgi:hypothetical protein